MEDDDLKMKSEKFEIEGGRALYRYSFETASDAADADDLPKGVQGAGKDGGAD